MRTMIKDNVIRNVPDGMVAKRTAEGYKLMDEPSQVPQNASETAQPQNDTNGAVKRFLRALRSLRKALAKCSRKRNMTGRNFPLKKRRKQH